MAANQESDSIFRNPEDNKWLMELSGDFAPKPATAGEIVVEPYTGETKNAFQGYIIRLEKIADIELYRFKQNQTKIRWEASSGFDVSLPNLEKIMFTDLPSRLLAGYSCIPNKHEIRHRTQAIIETEQTKSTFKLGVEREQERYNKLLYCEHRWPEIESVIYSAYRPGWKEPFYSTIFEIPPNDRPQIGVDFPTYLEKHYLNKYFMTWTLENHLRGSNLSDPKALATALREQILQIPLPKSDDFPIAFRG